MSSTHNIFLVVSENAREIEYSKEHINTCVFGISILCLGKVIIVPTSTTMLELVSVHTGIFSSKTQAKKNGWNNKPIPAGFNEIKIGKNQIWLWNPSCPWTEEDEREEQEEFRQRDEHIANGGTKESFYVQFQ